MSRINLVSPARVALATATLAIALCVAMFSMPAHSEAAQLRYMDWNRYDVLLDRHETNVVSSKPDGAAFICWQLGVAGRFGIVPCVSMVSVCGAHGRLRGRLAGMTFQPFSGWRFWCWQYG